MKNLFELNEKELLLISGGSEESYSLGFKIGEFLGAFTSNLIHAMDAFADGVREGVEAVKVLK
jgi:hypothetical protein